MKTKVNSERRKFFGKLGVGAVVSAFMVGRFSVMKLFALPKSGEKKTEQRISVAINPMAVKRTRKN